MEGEGVIKFRQDFIEGEPIELSKIRELNRWRQILYAFGLIGEDCGIGYGNLSQRVSDSYAEINKKSFIITGTQTGCLEKLTGENYTTVNEYYPEKNLIVSEGPIEASSESMTHGALYDVDDKIGFVFHAHSPEIWNMANELGIPQTRRDVKYGTPEMAKEVQRLFIEESLEKSLFRERAIIEKGIFSMGGHENGIISYGRTADEAGFRMLHCLSKLRVF